MRKIVRINYSMVNKKEAEQLLTEAAAKIGEIPGRTTLENGLLAYWHISTIDARLISLTIHKEDRRVQVIGQVTFNHNEGVNVNGH